MPEWTTVSFYHHYLHTYIKKKCYELSKEASVGGARCVQGTHVLLPVRLLRRAGMCGHADTYLVGWIRPVHGGPLLATSKQGLYPFTPASSASRPGRCMYSFRMGVIHPTWNGPAAFPTSFPSKKKKLYSIVFYFVESKDAYNKLVLPNTW